MKIMLRKGYGLLVLLSVSFVAFAAGIVTINTSNPPYSTQSNVVGTNIYSMVEIRIAAGFQILGAYNTLNSNNRLASGDQFEVKWQDGSTEKYAVSTPLSSVGTTPVPGTQQVPPNSGGGGPGGYAGDFGSGGGDNPFADCFSDTSTGCVSVGDGPMQCETYTVLNCPLG
jgi:hypothetical protein